MQSELIEHQGGSGLMVSDKGVWRVQGSVAREVPESPRQAKAKAKENKKARDGGMPATPARTPQTSEYAEQLKKVILSQFVNSRPGSFSAAALLQGLHHCCWCHLSHSDRVAWQACCLNQLQVANCPETTLLIQLSGSL